MGSLWFQEPVLYQCFSFSSDSVYRVLLRHFAHCAPFLERTGFPSLREFVGAPHLYRTGLGRCEDPVKTFITKTNLDSKCQCTMPIPRLRPWIKKSLGNWLKSSQAFKFNSERFKANTLEMASLTNLVFRDCESCCQQSYANNWGILKTLVNFHNVFLLWFDSEVVDENFPCCMRIFLFSSRISSAWWMMLSRCFMASFERMHPEWKRWWSRLNREWTRVLSK